MSRAEIINEAIETIRASESVAADKYEEWAGGHTNSFIEVRKYDPEADPSQRIEVVHIPARPDLDRARLFGQMGMGEAGYADMVRQFVESGMLRIAHQKFEENKNLLVVTPHLEFIWDTALTHNGLFVATEDPAFARRNLIVINQMLKFLKMGEVAVTDILASSGEIIIGDVIEGAKSHGVPTEVSQSVNRLASPILKKMLEEGVVFHRALTGTRANETPQGLVVPRVDSVIARGLGGRTPDAFPVAIHIEPGNGKAEVLDMQHIESEEDVHEMMEDLARSSAKLKGGNVKYEGGSLGFEAT